MNFRVYVADKRANAISGTVKLDKKKVQRTMRSATKKINEGWRQR